MKKPRGPPPGADRLLERALPAGLRGLSIVGDLHLEFAEVAARQGERWARMWYWKEALALGLRYAWVGMRTDREGRGGENP